MSINIFDLLKENIDFKTEVARIETLFSKNKNIIYSNSYFSIEEFVDSTNFKIWKNRNMCISCEDMRIKLCITEFHLQNFMTIEVLLKFLQYVENIVYLFEISYKINKSKFTIKTGYNMLKENIKSLLDYINYETKYYEEDQMAIIVEKNEGATAVAELVDDEKLAFKVIQYNHFILKGDLNRKQEILLALGHYFEPKRKNLNDNGYKNLADQTAFLLNNINIRHNNCDINNKKYYQEYTASMAPDIIELWYDKAYELLLFSTLSINYISLKEEVKDLMTKY